MQYRARRKKRLIIIGGIALVAVLFVAYIVLLFAVTGPLRQLETLQERRADVEAKTEELRQYGELKLEIDAVEETVVQAMGEVPHWRLLLEDIGRNIPEGVWLTDFYGDYGDNSNELVLTGWAHNRGLVANWLDKLEGIEMLEEVRFQSSAKGEYENVTHVDFEITAVIQPGEPFYVPEGGE